MSEYSAERARSFGAVAQTYDRTRPTPLPAALDWLLPRGCRDVVDLGAGTGLLSRALTARGLAVTAVEPDPRMRAVLAGRSAGVRVVDGTFEASGLSAGCADAVLAASSWHWADPPRALPEIARILRPGGTFGALWTARDTEVPWVAALSASDGRPATSTDEDRVRRSLPDDPRFGPVEHEVHTGSMTLSLDDAVAQLGTYSHVITASDEERNHRLQAAYTLLRTEFGSGPVVLPLRSWTWRTTRL